MGLRRGTELITWSSRDDTTATRRFVPSNVCCRVAQRVSFRTWWRSGNNNNYNDVIVRRDVKTIKIYPWLSYNNLCYCSSSPSSRASSERTWRLFFVRREIHDSVRIYDLTSPLSSRMSLEISSPNMEGVWKIFRTKNLKKTSDMDL